MRLHKVHVVLSGEDASVGRLVGARLDFLRFAVHFGQVSVRQLGHHFFGAARGAERHGRLASSTRELTPSLYNLIYVVKHLLLLRAFVRSDNPMRSGGRGIRSHMLVTDWNQYLFMPPSFSCALFVINFRGRR